MKKTFLTICTILFTCTLIFSACGQNTSEQDNTTKEASAVTEDKKEKKDMDSAVEDTTEPDVSEQIVEETPERILPQLVNPVDTDFVPVADYIPGIFVDLRYATANNFTGQVIYNFTDVYLRYGTVMKLKAVNEELASMGYALKIWDGFRPVSAQFKLWEVYPDGNYVANPTTGYSSHSKGNTIDLTLVDLEGNDVIMPTGFDEFSAKADRNYSDCTQEEANHSTILQTVMEAHGFSGYYVEWWHFSDTTSYSVEECFDPSLISRMHVASTEDVTLLAEPYTSAAAITQISNNAEIYLLGRIGEFSYIDYNGTRGYLSSHLIK